VQPSLKDWLDCPGTSNRRPVDTPAVAIEVILSKHAHNFHTCCTMCIHILQCNFLHVSFTPLHMLQCHFLHVSVTLFYIVQIYMYIYVCNFLCLTLHILFYCSPLLKNTKFYWLSIILWWRKILMSFVGNGRAMKGDHGKAWC